MSSNVSLRFLGTGTSQGVPVIACPCPVCASTDARDKRLRCSALIETADIRLLIDAGPDFRQQMLRAGIHHIDGIFLTHEHKDHTGGLDDVRALNYVHRSAVKIYAHQRALNSVEREYAYAFAENPYPGVPEMELCPIDSDMLKVKHTHLQIIRASHYRIEVLGLRIKGLAYLTDANYISEEEKAKLRGLDVLVINALRKEKHLSHFCLKEALDLIEELKPARAYLTHVSHQMGFYEQVSKELPEHVFLAYDDLQISTEL